MKKKVKDSLKILILNGFALLIALISLALLISFLTYSEQDPSIHSAGATEVLNWCGIIGSYIADIFIVSIGMASFFIPVFGLAIAYKVYKHKRVSFLKTKLVCLMLSMLLFSIAFAYIMPISNYKLMGGMFGTISLNYIFDLLSGFPKIFISHITGGIALVLLLVAVGFTPREYKNFFV